MNGFTGLDIHFDGDDAWPDLAPDAPNRPEVVHGDLTSIAALANGTAKGKPSVAFRVELPDGRVVIAQTTLALLVTATRGFMGRHGDPTA